MPDSETPPRSRASPPDPPPPDALGEAVSALGPALLEAMDSMETALRRLYPPDVPALREALDPIAAALDQRLAGLRAAACPPELDGFRDRLAAVAGFALDALRCFLGAPLAEASALGGSGGPEQDAPLGPRAMLRAMHLHARAQEAAWPLRRMLPPFSAFFAEPGDASRLAELDPAEPAQRDVGLFNAHNAADERGGFTLYVPESWDGEPWPLVMALHGGMGHGADFLWTWLREARCRRVLLLAPTSRGTTWSLAAPEQDAAALASMLAFVESRWSVDRRRVLLTGLSDGATFSLLAGLAEGAPYTHLAPVSGVLHPMNAWNGNLARAAARPIRLVHGALDWMFPVELARLAASRLREAGAALEYVEIADLSHTYPREQNAAILDWFVPGRR